MVALSCHPAKYHRQDDIHYSGAACAQIVIDELGQPIARQDTLKQEIAHHMQEPWVGADPDGLCQAIRDLKPPPPPAAPST